MNRSQLSSYHEHFIQQLFRLFKLTDFHDATNQAVTQSIEEALPILNELGAMAGGALSALFDGRDIFLNGQPLLAKRAVYEQSRQLGERIESMGAQEVLLKTPLTRTDLEHLITHSKARTPMRGVEHQLSPRVRLRKKAATPHTQLHSDLPPQELVARSAASALVVIERLYEGLKQGDYSTVRYAKRIARNIVLIGQRYPRLLLGFISSCPDRGDVATLAVKGAILSTLTLGQLTRDVRNLTDLALTALLHDAGLIRACGMLEHAETHGLISLPEPDERANARLPESSAAMMYLFGSMGDASLARSVYTHEAHALLQAQPPTPGELPPTLEGLILATTRRFLQRWMSLLDAQRQAHTQPMHSHIDQAIEALDLSATTRLERMVIDLFLSSMSLHRRGSPVELGSGWRGVVVANHERPACFGRPIVRLLQRPAGDFAPKPRDIDLSLTTHEAVLLGCITRSLSEKLDPAFEQARAHVLDERREPKRKRLTFPAPPALHAQGALAESPLDDDDDSDSLARLESLSQVRRAPWLPQPEPTPLDEASAQNEDEHELPSNTSRLAETGASSIWRSASKPLAWDDRETTAHSDRHQMLNIADIAHMIPDAIADQTYKPIDYTEPELVAKPMASIVKAPAFEPEPEPLAWGNGEETDFDVSPVRAAMNKEDWNRLIQDASREEISQHDDTSPGEHSDQIRVLSGSFQFQDVLTEQGPATALLTPADIAAFRQDDLRKHALRHDELPEVDVEPLTPEELAALQQDDS